jgi:hypothetical protein
LMPLATNYDGDYVNEIQIMPDGKETWLLKMAAISIRTPTVATECKETTHLVAPPTFLVPQSALRKISPWPLLQSWPSRRKREVAKIFEKWVISFQRKRDYISESE